MCIRDSPDPSPPGREGLPLGELYQAILRRAGRGRSDQDVDRRVRVGGEQPFQQSLADEAGDAGQQDAAAEPARVPVGGRQEGYDVRHRNHFLSAPPDSLSLIHI